MKLSDYITEKISVEDMRQYINNTVNTLGDSNISHIYNYIRAHGGDEKMYDFLKEKFPLGGDIVIKNIIRIIIDNGCVDDMDNIISGGPLITWDAFEQGDNIVKLIHDLGYGVNDGFIEDMMDLQLKLSGKNVGEGETLLQLFLDGGHMSKVGDVGVGKDKIVEIKSTNSHFTGQTGWGKGSSVSKYFLSNIEKYPALYNIYINHENDFARSKYQMWYKSDKDIKTSGFCQFIIDAKDNDLYEDLLEITSDSISNLYTDTSILSSKDILNFFKDVDIFDEKNKNLNGIKICNCLAALDLYYYMGKEKSFTHLCVMGGLKSSTNRKYKYKLFSRDDFSTIKSSYEQICNYMSTDCPNTKPGATAQDSFTGINIKG